MEGAVSHAMNYVLSGLLLTAIACASSGSRSTRQSSSDKLTHTELATSNAANAYDAINRLRPNWLRVSGTASIGGGVRSQLVLVYIDNQRAEDLYALKNISTGMVESAQWIDATRMATVLSNVPPGSYSGAILIKTH